MKKKINAILVVEGKTDIAFLSSFIDAEFVSTNGSDVPEETINYLKKQQANKEIIVFTDPDTPGQLIRAKLDEAIPGLKHSYVAKKDAIKNGKVGVAETSQKRILEALNFQIKTNTNNKSDLKEIDLYELGLLGSKNATEKRNYVAAYFHLGFVNAKQLLKRARSMNLTHQIIKEAIDETNG
jgi:ribonuclease M5